MMVTTRIAIAAMRTFVRRFNGSIESRGMTRYQWPKTMVSITDPSSAVAARLLRSSNQFFQSSTTVNTGPRINIKRLKASESAATDARPVAVAPINSANAAENLSMSTTRLYMTVSAAEMMRKMTGSSLPRTGDGNRKVNPSVTPRRIAAVRLANLKKLLPMLRGEMKSSVSIMPTPSWENRKKKVEEIIRFGYKQRRRS